MTRVLIDASIVREGGPLTYFRHLLPALLRHHAHAHEYHVLLSTSYQEHLISEVPTSMKVVAVNLPAQPLARWWALQRLLPRLLRAGQYDLLFSAAEIGAVRVPCAHVALVRNPNYFTPLKAYPGLSQRMRLLSCRLFRQPAAWLTLRGADRLIFVSESCRQTVTSQVPALAQKARVVYHGVDPVFRHIRHNGTGFPIADSHPYILSVSSIDEHKNFEALIRGFARLVSQDHDASLQLLIAGANQNLRVYESLLTLAHDLAIAPRVHFLGSIGHVRLAALYRKAQVFVLPSRLETFGHPLVEAMASGVPVVASDLPVSREICQDAACYFPPDDVGTLVTQVTKVLGDSEIRAAMVHRGLQRAGTFSWERTAEELVHVFDEVTGRLHHVRD